MDFEQVKDIFQNEFGLISDRFHIYDLSVKEAAESKAEHIWKPGVYVFWTPTRVVKVGRSLTNARKRALEHIRDDTGGTMQQLSDDPEARIVLFSLKNARDRHWAAAVEIFLEDALSPEIPSQRNG